MPVLLANLVWSIIRLAHFVSYERAFMVLLALALVVLAFTARTMALTVQDRVICLEERLRMRELLPADLQPRIGEFTRNQLVALRFAGDAELPALARKVLAEKLDNRKAIKQQIQNWKADDLRA
jgi:cell division protein FtsL